MSKRVKRSRLRVAFPEPERARNVIADPDFDQLREFTRHHEQTTEYGSPAYISDQKSRSADQTRNLVGAARGEIEWAGDENFGFEVPAHVPNIDVDLFYPPEHYDDFEAELADLRAERRAYLDQFETLDEEIKESVY